MNTCRPDRVKRRATRHGMAPLEMVLALPFMLGAFALIIAVAIASIKKSETAIHARNAAWQVREPGDGEEPFVLSGAATRGHKSANESRQFVLPPPPISTGRTLTAQSRNVILTGSWADPLAGMSEEQTDFIPHLTPLGIIASQGSVNLGGLDQLINKLANLPSGGGVFLAALSKGMNGALYFAGLEFRILSDFTNVMSQISELISWVSDAADYLDNSVGDVVQSVVDWVFDELDELGIDGAKDAFDAVKKATKILKNLANMRDRVHDLFEALYRASIGEDFEPNPTGIPLEELRQIFNPDTSDSDP